MNRDPQLRTNADELELTLARKRRALADLTDEEQRSRQGEVIDQLLKYVALLRVAGPVVVEPDDRHEPARVPFAFKLELADGRWDIEETSLASAPHAGDVLCFHGSNWRVRESRLVQTRPAGKPPREFFVCAPAA